MFLIDSKYLAMETDFSQKRKLKIQKKKKSGSRNPLVQFYGKGKEDRKTYFIFIGGRGINP